jgi:hypothetical protein
VRELRGPGPLPAVDRGPSSPGGPAADRSRGHLTIHQYVTGGQIDRDGQLADQGRDGRHRQAPAAAPAASAAPAVQHVTQGQLSLAALCAKQPGVAPATVLRLTAQNPPGRSRATWGRTMSTAFSAARSRSLIPCLLPAPRWLPGLNCPFFLPACRAGQFARRLALTGRRQDALTRCPSGAAWTAPRPLAAPSGSWPAALTWAGRSVHHVPGPGTGRVLRARDAPGQGPGHLQEAGRLSCGHHQAHREPAERLGRRAAGPRSPSRPSQCWPG